MSSTQIDSSTQINATRAADATVTASRTRFSFLAAFEVVVSIVVAVIFLQSAAAHLQNPYQFLSSVYQYELVGATSGRYLAMIIPYLQLVLAFCLIGRLFVPGALLASAGLLLMFVVAQSSALWRDLDISCGCFGVAESVAVSRESLMSVAALLAATLAAFACAVYRQSKSR